MQPSAMRGTATALHVRLHCLRRTRVDEHGHRCGARDDQSDPGAAPGDVFATRAANPVLQELEDPDVDGRGASTTRSGPSRDTNRINRPRAAADGTAAMCVLTDPSETGAVDAVAPGRTCRPRDSTGTTRFARRVWPAWPAIDDGAPRRAVDHPRRADAAHRGRRWGDLLWVLRRLCGFAEVTGVPVAETQAGKGSMQYDHPAVRGCLGATGTTALTLAAEADLVLGIGTRYSDFTTASKTVFAHPDVRFVNLNVAAFDAHKLAAVAAVADARRGLEQLTDAVGDWHAPAPYTQQAQELAREWDTTVQRAHDLGHTPLPAQSEVPGVVNRLSGPRDVVVCAAGSMPGDLHKLWRTRDPKGYHVEYGFSCMGYEIAGGLGVKMAVLDTDDDRDVFVMVGDGSYLMMAQELVTAVQGRGQADRRLGAEPRVRLHRGAAGVARLAAVRHPLSVPHRPWPGRRRAARRPGRQCRQPAPG